MSSALQKINQQDDPCNKTGSLIFGIKLENFTNFSFHKTGVFLTWHLKASPEGAWHNNPMAELLTLKKKIKKNMILLYCTCYYCKVGFIPLKTEA